MSFQSEFDERSEQILNFRFQLIISDIRKRLENKIVVSVHVNFYLIKQFLFI